MWLRSVRVLLLYTKNASSTYKQGAGSYVLNSKLCTQALPITARHPRITSGTCPCCKPTTRCAPAIVWGRWATMTRIKGNCASACVTSCSLAMSRWLPCTEVKTSTDFGVDDNLMVPLGTSHDFDRVIEFTAAMALQTMSGKHNAALGVAPQVFAASRSNEILQKARLRAALRPSR